MAKASNGSKATAERPARRLRIPLSLKFVTVMVALVALLLAAAAALSLWSSHSETERAALAAQQQKADLLAGRIDDLISDIESQLAWTAQPDWKTAGLERQRADFARMLRQFPGITELFHTDDKGLEQLKVSRLAPDSVASLASYANDPRFTGTVEAGKWFGPVYVRNGADLVGTIGVAHADGGVTIAELDLAFLTEPVKALADDATQVFVVDGAGRLVAHPSQNPVAGETDLSALPQVAAALAAGGSGTSTDAVTEGDAAPAFAAWSPIPRLGWTAIVQTPKAVAMAPFQSLLWQTALLCAIGLLAAMIVAMLLARRVAVPIERLRAGAERLADGDLAQRVDIARRDEIGALADKFNAMANHLQQSQKGLEAKIDDSAVGFDVALQQHSITVETLRTISRTDYKLERVLDQLIGSTVTLSEANVGAVWLREGEAFRLAAQLGHTNDWVEAARKAPFTKDTDAHAVAAAAAYSGQLINVDDVARDLRFMGEYGERPANGDERAALAVPLKHGGRVEAVVSLSRADPIPFTDRQVALAQDFADQALIAIRTVRLAETIEAGKRELAASVEEQDAANDILHVVAQQPADVRPVLGKIVESAARLCDAPYGHLFLFDGAQLHFKAEHGLSPAAVELTGGSFPAAPAAGSLAGQAIEKREAVLVADLQAEAEALSDDLSRLLGIRSAAAVPLMKDGAAIGVMTVADPGADAIPEGRLAVLKTLADQAVVALTASRLADELSDRTSRLADVEAAEQQRTAELDEARQRHEADLAETKKLHAEELGQRTAERDEWSQRHAADMEAAEQRRIAELDETRRQHAAEVEETRLRHEAELAEISRLHAEELGERTAERDDWSQRYAADLEAAEQRRAAELDQTNLRHAAEVEEIRQRHEAELAEMRRLHAEELGERTAERDDWSQRHEADTHAAEQRRIAELDEMRGQHAAEIDEARRLHTEDVDQTQQRYEAELAETKKLHAEVLGERTAERDDWRQRHEADVAAAEQRRVAQLDETNLRHAAEVEETRLRHEGELAEIRRLHAEELGERVAERDEWRQRHAADTEAAEQRRVVELDETGQRHVAEMEEVRRRHEAELGEMSSLHEGQLGETIATHAAEIAETIATYTAQLNDARRLHAAELGEAQRLHAEESDAARLQQSAAAAELGRAHREREATAGMLAAIGRSRFDLGAVLDTLARSAAELCDAGAAAICLDTGSALASACSVGLPQGWLDDGRHRQIAELAERAAREAIPLWSDDAADGNALAVPLLSEAGAVGALVIARDAPFGEAEAALAATLADQAAIAVANTRLIAAVEARAADFQEALRQQASVAEVLKAIGQPAFSLDGILTTLTASAAALCGAGGAAIYLLRDGAYRVAAATGAMPADLVHAQLPGRDSWIGAAALDAAVIHVGDVEADTSHPEIAGIGGLAAILCVPLVSAGSVAGVFALTRSEPKQFSARQIDLVRTFADEIAIAIEHIRLSGEMEARGQELAAAQQDLHAAQARLGETERLASLGRLRDGIAHDIAERLKAVNDVSLASNRLVDDIRMVLEAAIIDGGTRAEVEELGDALKEQLDKAVWHGQRADGVVRNTLLQSLEGAGDRHPVDINAVVDESLGLAYHGARAERQGFDATLEKALDPKAGAVDLHPQEITRVLLNLFANGFDATAKRKAAANGSGYRPVLAASTRNLGDAVEITIRDNGTGIAADVRERMFDPYFTTKPAGEGTGLGLSLSRDIIVRQHGGTIEVDSEPGVFTEFRIVLPRGGSTLAKGDRADA